MLFEVVKGMTHKIPLTKLVLIDSDLHLCLDALLVVVFYKAGDMIWVPKKGNAIALIEKEFEKFLENEGVKIYNGYGLFSRDYRLHVLFENPEDLEGLHK